MAQRGVLRTLEGGRVSFHCPGCGNHHQIPIEGPGAWSFNEDWLKPTFHPSILVRNGHFAANYDGGSCWCSFNAERPDEIPDFTCIQCHSFVVDGQIQFLSDCSHALAGQTVSLEARHGFDEC